MSKQAPYIKQNSSQIATPRHKQPHRLVFIVVVFLKFQSTGLSSVVVCLVVTTVVVVVVFYSHPYYYCCCGCLRPYTLLQLQPDNTRSIFGLIRQHGNYSYFIKTTFVLSQQAPFSNHLLISFCVYACVY